MLDSLAEIIEKHGIIGVQFEQHIFKLANHFSADYESGYWQSKTLENESEGFYLTLDNNKTYTIQNCPNFQVHQKEDVQMDSKAFSLCVWIMALNIFGSTLYSDGHEDIADDFIKLQHYAMRNIEQITGEYASDVDLFLD